MFILDSNKRQPLNVKLYNQIKDQIVTGKLPPHSRLPSVRDLAGELAISRNTVEYAYEQLCTEGFIYSKARSGYFIAALDQEFIIRSSQTRVNSLRHMFAEEKQYTFDFHPASLLPDSFPTAIWRKLFADCLRDNAGALTRYSEQQGERELRGEIQRYLERSRGVICEQDQIVICSGLHDSLAIVAQILRAEHSQLAVEEPGYWIPRSVFQNHSFSITPVPVNVNGLDVEYLQTTSSTVVYVTPSHQFPLGYVMPVESRLRLIQWAETVNGVIIEDDYDSELRYHGKPIPALQGLHPAADIIYAGTFSKVLSPALRISYLVLPYPLLARYHGLFGGFPGTVSLLEQKILARFIKDGYWERHLRKLRTIYKKKHDLLLGAIERHFGSRASIIGQGAGLHVVLELSAHDIEEKELILRAQAKDIRVFPFADTCLVDAGRNSRIMLGFGGMSPDKIEQGVKLLYQCCYEA
ncbi:PLP-dependent aminotransferase family protein [Sporomusa aerivorans]|uniref:MocR-like pyridoxine biosynthesis transcription factor PdxR n=1 Tax=Sporomusa aerivorans TaxID=204936 RepID=UPI00352B952C